MRHAADLSNVLTADGDGPFNEYLTSELREELRSGRYLLHFEGIAVLRHALLTTQVPQSRLGALGANKFGDKRSERLLSPLSHHAVSRAETPIGLVSNDDVRSADDPAARSVWCLILKVESPFVKNKTLGGERPIDDVAKSKNDRRIPSRPGRKVCVVRRIMKAHQHDGQGCNQQQ